MSKLFTVEKWQETCEKISREAARTCGCIHDVYVGNYSLAVERQVSSIPEEHQVLAFQIAKEIGDYATPEERDRSVHSNLDDGYCRHGLRPDCCPCGCGDLD